MFGWLCRASFAVVSTSMLGVSHAVQKEKKLTKFTHEVLVLGLLVVVYTIPYISYMFNTSVVLEPDKMQLVCAHHTAVYRV